MKKILLPVSVLMLLINPALHSQWFPQTSSNINTFSAVWAIDANTAYATTQFSVYKTSNAGITWSVNLTDVAYFDDVVFANPNTGYVIGRASGGAHIYKTINGGANWTIIGNIPVLTKFSFNLRNKDTLYAIPDWEDGDYQIRNVPAGTYSINFKGRDGYKDTTIANITVTATTSQSVAASITVVSFTGVDTSGTNGSGAVGATGGGNANPGAPTATLIATRSNSWVFGVGSDWDTATARTTFRSATSRWAMTVSLWDPFTRGVHPLAS